MYAYMLFYGVVFCIDILPQKFQKIFSNFVLTGFPTRGSLENKLTVAVAVKQFYKKGGQS